MELVSVDNLQIGLAPAERRAEALELAFSSLPETERRALAEQTLRKAAESAAASMFEARRDGRLVGALYCELQLGGSAGLWAPQIAAAAADDTAFAEHCAGGLLQAAIDWLAAQRVRVVQSLLTTDSGRDAERLRAAGFTHLTDLLYLVSLSNSFPAAPIETDLSFEPLTARDDDELAKLLEGTYEQTLDCPALNGVQDCREVLAGYRATGSFDPANWFFVRRGGQDAGCLLLADFPDVNQYLLVYMGLLPAARGKGLGIELVRHAQWLCGRAGRARLVLAVDAENAPAINIYASAGFVAWDRRSVWLRVLEGQQQACATIF